MTISSLNTWKNRDPGTGRHHRHGHLIELDGAEWKCRICEHRFDAAVDADLFWCGDPCRCRALGEA